MPAITLYGRRWHFSTDIVAVPAALAAFYHAAWIIILLVWAGATGSWPGTCASYQGVAYVAVVGGLLFTFALNLGIDALLVVHSLRGGPFEESKRRWVVPLLYAATLPLLTTLGFTAYGSHVCTQYEPDCWPLDRRNAVTNLAQGLVFATWGFMAVATLGIAITYNMYPQHHDLSSWEARCECLASALCCHANVVRRPDGKRPPLTNIAELTAGLLSHCDLDTTDITAALFLASAAQNRRRRLRVVRALLPVYQALRQREAGAGGGVVQGRLPNGGLGHDDDDAASASSASSDTSVNDVPADRELDRMIAEEQAQRAQRAQQVLAAAPGGPEEVGGDQLGQEGFTPNQQGPDRQGAQQQVVSSQPQAGAADRRPVPGKSVSWARESQWKLGPAAAAGHGRAEERPRGAGSAAKMPPSLGNVSAAEPPRQGGSWAGLEPAATAPVSPPASSPGDSSQDSGPRQAAEGAHRARTLPLTEETVALLDQQLAAMEAGQGGPESGQDSPRSPQRQAAAQQAADARQAAAELLEELPAHLPDSQQTEVVGQLADAIEEELRQLGGQELPDNPALAVSQQHSLDLSALQVDPESPSIWFSSNKLSAHGVSSSRLSGRDASTHARREAAVVDGDPEGRRAGEFGDGREEAGSSGQDARSPVAAADEAAQTRQLEATSPFYTAGGAAASDGDAPGLRRAGTDSESANASSGRAEPGWEKPGAGVRTGVQPSVAAGQPSDGTGAEQDAACKGSLPPAGEAVPPADDATAAAVAAVAAVAAAADAGVHQASEPAIAAASAFAAAVATGDGGGSATYASGLGRLSIQRQLTVKYPVVITPSEHVDDFRGPLPAAALADIYAGRHDKVPSSVLREALHFLKYSYAVYSLQPKVEAPSSALDVCACLARPPDPREVVFKGLSELEQLDDDTSVELLHLNCSNRVLSHLPYMICLDHGRKAVVLAIRGTISAADIVTDAIVYPEPLDSWLPPDIKQELSEPAFAHAGMVAAARAIFQDMTERGVLQQLVEDEEVGDYTAPQGQRAHRDGHSGTAGAAHGAENGSGRGARVPSPPASQYDADAGVAAPGAAQYLLGRGSGGRGGDCRPARAAESSNGTGRAAAGMAVNQQSSQREGPGGRLWETAAAPGGAAASDREGAKVPSPRPSAGSHRAARGTEGAAAGAAGDGGSGQQSPGRRVGEIMRQKIEEEGWQMVVEGHSLGAGAAALVSLKLRQHFPALKCIAYSCPGGLVSKNLAHAMAPFTTTVVVGKDAVCRASVGNLARLMDEMVTALARCRRPKLAVLAWPWWRRRRAHFRQLFWDYDDIPAEPLAVLRRYYDSRARIGQPLSMYPPGRLIFLRPIKTRLAKDWDAVWIQPEDIMAEGLLISPHALRDHLCSTAYESLTAAAARVEGLEKGAPDALSAEADARQGSGPSKERIGAERTRVAGPALPLPRRVVQRRWRQRVRARRSSSLQDVLIEAT